MTVSVEDMEELRQDILQEDREQETFALNMQIDEDFFLSNSNAAEVAKALGELKSLCLKYDVNFGHILNSIEDSL